MKRKQPSPDVSVTIEPGVVRLDFGGFTFEMFEDEALRMAREIHDALEGRHVPTGKRCYAMNNDYICTEPDGHVGDHIAWGADGEVCDQWSVPAEENV